MQHLMPEVPLFLEANAKPASTSPNFGLAEGTIALTTKNKKFAKLFLKSDFFARQLKFLDH